MMAMALVEEQPCHASTSVAMVAAIVAAQPSVPVENIG